MQWSDWGREVVAHRWVHPKIAFVVRFAALWLKFHVIHCYLLIIAFCTCWLGFQLYVVTRLIDAVLQNIEGCGQNNSFSSLSLWRRMQVIANILQETTVIGRRRCGNATVKHRPDGVCSCLCVSLPISGWQGETRNNQLHTHAHTQLAD